MPSRCFILLILAALIISGQSHALTVHTLYDVVLLSDAETHVNHSIGLQKMSILKDAVDDFDKYDMRKWVTQGNLWFNQDLLPETRSMFSSMTIDSLPKIVMNTHPVNPISMPLFPESSLVYEIENLSQAFSAYHYMEKPRSQNSPVPIPEPSSMVLIGVGISTLLLRKRRHLRLSRG